MIVHVAAAALLGLGGSLLSAQQTQAGTTPAKSDTTRAPRTLPAAVITTVGQRAILASESPASVVVLRRTDLDAAAAVTANQLLRQIPGLQELSSQPSQTSIAIRGLDAARVLVMVDGEPVAGSLIDNRDIGRLSTLSAERIEVTRGPSSVEFGSEALGGVINLVTAAPSSHFRVDGTLRGGGLGRRESQLEVSNTIGGLGVRLGGGWRQVDRVTAIDAASSTLDRGYDLRSDLRYLIANRVSVRGNVLFSRERQRWPVGGGYNGFVDNRSAQAFLESGTNAFGGYLRVRGFMQRYSYQYRQAQGTNPIAGTADSLEQREGLKRLLLAYTRTAGAHTVDIGAQYSIRGIRAPSKIEGDTADDRVSEIYARDSWASGGWRVVTGARATRSSLWGDAFNPTAGVTWMASEQWRVRANIARGFRAPGFKEIRYTFINPGGGYAVVGNSSLVPEGSWSTSAGFSWMPSAAWVVDVEAFRNELSNLIDTRLTGTNGAGLQIYQNVNVAKARTEGVELSARAIVGRYDATIGYEYLQAHDLGSGRSLDRRAAHTARAAVTGRWHVAAGLIGDLSARYTGAAPAGTTAVGALLITNGQLRLNLSSAIELSAGVNNLFDARAALWTAAYDRQWFGGVRVHR